MTPKNRKFRKTFSVFNRVLKNLFLIALILLTLFYYEIPYEKLRVDKQFCESSCIYNDTIERYFIKRKHWVTSNLGSILFKNQPIKYNQQNRTFTVLIWKHPYWSKTYLNDALKRCSVNNCIFTDDSNLIKIVDVVVVATYIAQFPWLHKRNTSQRWVILNNESPVNAFNNDPKKKVDIPSKIKSMANIFNWSMTYRSDSDVPTPYGRTVPLPEILMRKMITYPITMHIPYWESKQKDVLVVAVISNCYVPERMQYINELRKYIKVDLFGRCAKTTEMEKRCPLSSSFDCPIVKKYLFYLAFENSRCRQYLTEKVFHNAFTKGAIPVVMGAPESDYEKLLPPYSFLHVNSFDSPRDLAMEILNLSMNDDYLTMYHKWRHYFKINNELVSASDSYELCRLCEALNFNNNETKVYDLDSLKLYFDPKLLCTVTVNP